MFGSLGFGEVLLILFIVILVFGAPNLGKLGRGLGEGITNFRQGLKGDDKKPEEKKETSSN